MIKVLHLVTSMKRGGAERQLATIINHSSEVRNSLCSFRQIRAGYLNDPEQVTVLKSQHIVGKFTEFMELLRKLNPDLVYAWGPLPYMMASLAALRGDLKVVNGSIRHGVFKGTWHGYFRMVLLHLSRHIVANSAAGLKANRLKRGFILYNGIDPKFNQRIWQNIVQQKGRNTLNFVSVANLVPYKDYFTTLEALRMLKDENYDFFYTIIGDGPLRDDLEKDVSLKGLRGRVILIGSVENPEQHLAKADVFIHSSKGEGCSNAILEAMYMGLPVIATNTGGTSEIVGDNAILFEYQNVIGLYAALKKIMDDTELRKKMAEASYSIASTRFSVSRMLDDYQRIIQNIMST